VREHCRRVRDRRYPAHPPHAGEDAQVLPCRGAAHRHAREQHAQLPADRPPGLDQQDDRQYLQTGADGGHQVITNAWRKFIGYSRDKKDITKDNATLDDVWAAAQRIYSDYPDWLAAVKDALGK
jgi:hypothetical protein